MKKIAVFIFAFLLPSIAFAQTTENINTTIGRAGVIVNNLTTFLVAAAILVFIWGIVRYVIASDEEQKTNAQKLILWGVVGLFAIVAVWGLVQFLSNSTGIGGQNTPTLPCVPGTGGPC